MRSAIRTVAVIAGASVASSLLVGGSNAEPRTPAAQGERDAATARLAPPRHDMPRSSQARRSTTYKYATGGQHFLNRKPRGLSATFTVHKPKQVRWRRGDHSLAEIALARPGGNSDNPSYVEAGWTRGLGGRVDGKPRLFVFWWGLKGKPHCYNMRCKGFVRKGKGKKPGAPLKPGTKIRIGWKHKNNRWNLYVNGKRSGYYPDRLWKNKFNRIAFAQVFGEVAYDSRRGRCVGMGSGRHPTKRKGAKISKIRLHKPNKKAKLQRWSKNTKRYSYKRLSRNAFRYGGPGAC